MRAAARFAESYRSLFHPISMAWEAIVSARTAVRSLAVAHSTQPLDAHEEEEDVGTPGTPGIVVIIVASGYGSLPGLLSRRFFQRDRQRGLHRKMWPV